MINAPKNIIEAGKKQENRLFPSWRTRKGFFFNMQADLADFIRTLGVGFRVHDQGDGQVRY